MEVVGEGSWRGLGARNVAESGVGLWGTARVAGPRTGAAAGHDVAQVLMAVTSSGTAVMAFILSITASSTGASVSLQSISQGTAMAFRNYFTYAPQSPIVGGSKRSLALLHYLPAASHVFRMGDWLLLHLELWTLLLTRLCPVSQCLPTADLGPTVPFLEPSC